jgi:hypothetical protein
VSPPAYHHFGYFLPSLLFGSRWPPSLDTLYVWEGPDPSRERDWDIRPYALGLGNFHRDARIGAVAKLALLLESRIPLAEAARDACAHPVDFDARDLESLLPGSSRRHRKTAKAWARAYAARYDGRDEAETAAKIIADLQSLSRARRLTASATVTAIHCLQECSERRMC